MKKNLLIVAITAVVLTVFALFAQSEPAAPPVRAIDSSLTAAIEGGDAVFTCTVMVANDLPCDVVVVLTCGLLDGDNFIDGITQTYEETVRAGETRVVTAVFRFGIADLMAWPVDDLGLMTEWYLPEVCHETAI